MKTARLLASRFHAHDDVLYHNSVSNSMFSLSIIPIFTAPVTLTSPNFPSGIFSKTSLVT